MTPPRVRVLNFELIEVPMRTRMPFKYGIATLTQLPHLIVQFECEVNGRRQRGWAADGLAPKWFTKDPRRLVEDELVEMRQVIHAACNRAVAAGECASAAELYRRTKANVAENLLNNFGVSFVERGAIDAICRAIGRTFHDVLRSGGLGVTGDFLPPSPRQAIAARHTVGLADLLRGQQLDDGLPDSLESAIRAYGLTHFKIKLGGDVDADIARLREIADVLSIVPEYAFTLDANENYRAVEPVRALWERLARERSLEVFLSRLLFIEQPLHRDVALSHEVKLALARWPQRPAMIIDESDAAFDALATPLDVGYAGTSHKNCKGIFKGIANARLIARRPGLILSGEDLSTVGPVALLQDLAVQASLGVAHVERNGHHYFRGMSAFPIALQEQVVAAHPDLYRMHERGFATVIIREGRMSTGSVTAAPFGMNFELGQNFSMPV